LEEELNYSFLEEKLKKHFYNMNAMGLIVRDRYLLIKAKKIAEELNIYDFKASTGYLKCFKNRNNIVSRAQTSSVGLPENAKRIAVDFMYKIRTLIKEKGIKNKNILNFDQVPRYFEQKTNKLLTVKGSKNVKIFKANSSHARFNFTPLVMQMVRCWHAIVFFPN
jgi:hypothetical protein